jgi:Tfp pilus assembly protein FimT
MVTVHDLGIVRSRLDRTGLRHLTAGFKLLELVIVLAVAVVVMSTAIPSINKMLNMMHLGSAASSLAGAIQAVRYQAISVGCPFTITINASPANSYQVQTEPVTGTPPACSTSGYVNVGSAVTFANSDVTISSATTFALNPSGTVSTVGTPTVPASFSIVLAHGSTTKTVKVTGVGNVQITSP